MVSLPSYQQTLFMPTFPGVGQLTGGVLGSAVSLQAATLAAMTTGQKMNYLTIENSMEMLQMLDYLLSASTSMLNVLASLQEELKLVGGRSSGFLPLLTEGRCMIAARLWSAQRCYLRTFQNVIHKETPVVDPVAQQSYLKAFQSDIPEQNYGGISWSVGAGSQNFARRNYQKGNETIDLTCSNDEMLKKRVHSSTVSSDPLLSKCDRDGSSGPFDIRLTDVHGVFKSDCKLFETTKTSLANLPSCHRRRRKYPMTAA